MPAMKVRVKVVGNTLVPDEDVNLPEGARVEVVLCATGEGVYVDEASEAELAAAMGEADTEKGRTTEEVFGQLPPRRRSA